MESGELSEEKAPFSPDVEQDPDTLEFEDVEDLEPAEAEEAIKAAALEHFDDALNIYLREIQKTKLLSAVEEKELAAKIDLGDKAARDRMIVSNLRLVVKIARRYLHRGMPFLDLIEEGNIGLIKAVDRYKLSKECRLSTYACWWIRQSIERMLLNQLRTIRLPVNVTERINKMLRITNELAKELNREPTSKEVADFLNLNETSVRRLLVLMKKTCSLEQPMGVNSEYFLTDIIQDTSTVSPAVLLEDLIKYELVSKSLETLSYAEKKILALRFGLEDKAPQTLEAIGKSFGVTRERIRQIEWNAMKKLRKIVQSTDAMEGSAKS